MIFRPFFVPPKVFVCFLFFGFGLCLFLFDGFIIAMKKAPNHQQCWGPLMLKQQLRTLVLIIGKKVFEKTKKTPADFCRCHVLDLFSILIRDQQASCRLLQFLLQNRKQ